MTDIRDIKPLLVLEYPWLPVLLTALGLALMLAGAWLWWRMHRQKADVVPDARPLTPYEMAQQLLWALRAEKLIDQGLVAEFYLRLSRIMREFFEALFGFPATGFTSHELLRALGERRINPHLIQLVEQFYRHCDFIKFTSSTPSRAEMQAALDHARRLIEETERQAGEQRTVSITGALGVGERVAVR